MPKNESGDEFEKQFDRHDIESCHVEMADILSIQALAMGYIRRRARTKKSDYNRRSYAFSMLYAPGDLENVYDGSQDTYMSCTVRKVDFDQWCMRVSFLSTLNMLETARVNTREVFAFDWLRNGNRMAWTWTTKHTINGTDLTLETLDLRPLESYECDELNARMTDHCDMVNPILPGSMWDELVVVDSPKDYK